MRDKPRPQLDALVSGRKSTALERSFSIPSYRHHLNIPCLGKTHERSDTPVCHGTLISPGSSCLFLESALRRAPSRPRSKARESMSSWACSGAVQSGFDRSVGAEIYCACLLYMSVNVISLCYISSKRKFYLLFRL